jgi:putative sugar O-methyltransferase
VVNLRNYLFPQSRLLKVDSQELQRVQAFRSSPSFNVQSGSYSSYWTHHAKLIEVSSSSANSSGESEVEVSGESGFYITPYDKTVVVRLKNSLARSVKAGRLGRHIKTWSTYPSPVMMTYENAYDLLMNSSEGHPRLPGAIPFPLTSRDVRREFKAWSDHEGTGHVLLAYYLLSIIMKQAPLPPRPLRILEIGPGNGNQASLFLNYFPGTRITLVDLPETLQLSFLYLRSLFPHLEFVLPHEVTSERIMTADVVFLTPDQIDLVPDGSVDIGMNIHSFQEMLMPQIASYFTLLERVTRPDGYVLVVNRSEKMPNVEETSIDGIGCVRFAEYPWVGTWTDVIHATSPFHLLVQTDDVMIRLAHV